MGKVPGDDDTVSVFVVVGHVCKGTGKAGMRVKPTNLFAGNGEVNIGNMDDLHGAS
jgi:hypothetical protein